MGEGKEGGERVEEKEKEGKNKLNRTRGKVEYKEEGRKGQER